MDAGTEAGQSGGGDAPHTFVSYGEFGEAFFREAVTADRVLGAVNALAGQPIRVGPTGVGPGRLAKLRASGVISAGSISATSHSPLCFLALLPLELAFEIDLGVERQRFQAEVVIPLRLTARAAEGLKVVIDITAPVARDITLDVRAQGMRATLLQRIGGIDTEVRRFVATYVARELAEPHVRKATVIDVAGAIDAAWASLAAAGEDVG